MIKGLAEKPLELSKLKEFQKQEEQKVLDKEKEKTKVKVTRKPVGKEKVEVPFAKERTKEERIQDAKIKDLLIRYKKGAESPENKKEIERLEKIKKDLEDKGKKISPKLQEDINALKA